MSPQVAVVQFSNDVRVELPLEPLDRSAFHALMASMVRGRPRLTCVIWPVQPAYYAVTPSHAVQVSAVCMWPA
jgi:hypothetical protein